MSAASARKIPLETIMKSVVWHTDRTFQKVYQVPDHALINYGEELLKLLS